MRPIIFLPNWLYITNHKQIACIYFFFGAWAGCVGFRIRFLIRLNNARPGGAILTPEVYLTVVTAHALVIIFFFVMPLYIGGFGNWLIPIILGIPDMALARVNAFRFWALPPALTYLLVGGGTEGGVNVG